jgi:hypothetical protein
MLVNGITANASDDVPGNIYGLVLSVLQQQRGRTLSGSRHRIVFDRIQRFLK